ncbi:hypothetical protein EMCG_08295 [[Emmonsia] crescens]|uniref:Uncharacterized protein n=1 Tax=[Emmonsia] crescens TaxID=73230 RepID=A0A0G2I5R4_9EURO|nr:hypothetical protein EMCG_08295 [Emmonsia crescens UAMH 3008]
MIRRLSTLISPKRASQRTRENVEDRSRYYDVDNAVANSRPRSPLIDRQCLSPATERQLQNACLFLSRKIEFPDRWNEFDTCADLTDASPSSSHFPDLKIPSFTIPDHIESGINGDPTRVSNVLSNENENGTPDSEDKREFGVCIDLKRKHFGHEQSVALLTIGEASEISSSIKESKCQSHFSNEQNLLHETFTYPPTENWKNSSEVEQEDMRPRSAIQQQPINEEPQPKASSKERNMSPTEHQILQNSHPEGSDSLSSPILENTPLDPYLKWQAEIHAKQRLRNDTNLSPISDDHCERDLSMNPLTHTQSWSSRSTGCKIIIDANGLEKVMTVDEERQRRLGLQRAVMEKMSGGCIAPAPHTNKVATLHSKPPTQHTSPTCDIAGANGQLNKFPDAKLDEQAQLPWDQQTKNTLVRKLSRLTLGKKKSIAKMNNVLGFSAIVEAR